MELLENADARALFIVFVLLMLALYKALNVAWHLGYQARRDRDVQLLIPDQSVRQRL